MSSVWREPIFDRTFRDVEVAIQKLAEWKTNHTHATDIQVDDALVMRTEGSAYVADDKLVVQDAGVAYVEDGVLMVRSGDVYELKGCFNLLDLNRIEDNIVYLAEKMGGFSYTPTIHSKRWTRVDMPNQDDMVRITENIHALMNAFYTPSNPPYLSYKMLSYSDINAIEETLYLIKQMLDCMQSSFKQAGTIKSGSTTFLPLRR